MTLIGRMFVRGAAAASAIGAATVIALAPQPGVAGNIGVDDHTTTTGTVVRTSEPAPSAACVAARTAFFAALKADVAEDASERDLAKTGANANDATEDQSERANFVALRKAMFSACEPAGATQPRQAPTPTAQCTSAKTALKAFFTQLRATETAEWANHTEGTAADRAADQASWAQARTLFQNVVSACGFTRFDQR